MQIPTFKTMKPRTRIAVVVILVCIAFFLTVPFIVGSGTPGGAGYPIDPADHISSWKWHGVYEDGAQKQADVEKEIGVLKGELGKGRTPDYDLYVGIASEYELLGDGKSAYQYLSKAIRMDGKRGLAYMNMGHLMEEMGALATAHTAYDAAVAAEPSSTLYQTARQDFLIHHTQTATKAK